jgi:exopolyphosphatase/guanosine-5'-triphosphate,3'-diphosphate pyrophosphatase
VARLAALLRLADALDHEHAGRVHRFHLERSGIHVTLHLFGTGDLLLEKWSLLRKGDLFEQTFKVVLSVTGGSHKGNKHA